MHDHDHRQDPATEPALTTEDLAGRGQADEAPVREGAAAPGSGGAPPVYPGEATGERAGGSTDPARTAESANTVDADEMTDPPLATGAVGATGPTGAAGPTGADAEDGRNGEEIPADRPAPPDAGTADEPLLAPTEAERYRTAWSDIQVRFVDDPQDAVTSADTLVAEVMQDLAGTFASHKQELQGQWQRGDDVATEDLRLALQHYRSFFNRLLNT